jgi:hypothetical protein
MLQTLGVMIGGDRIETRLIVQGNYHYNSLKNRVVRAGNLFTLVKQNAGSEIILWDDLSSEQVFMIMPSYTPGTASSVIDAGTKVALDADLYGNPRPSGGSFDIGAVETQ